MITLSLGAVGSGKTLSLVREMALNPHKRYYANIQTNLPNVTLINQSMIMIPVEGEKGKTKYMVNVPYWEQQKRPFSIIIDEAHTLFSSRSSLSQKNKIFAQFLALCRKITSDPQQEGQLVLITQYLSRIDLAARLSCDTILMHIAHYGVYCTSCKDKKWVLNSEMPNDLKIEYCPHCHKLLKRYGWCIEVFHFDGIENFYEWKYKHKATFYKHYYLRGNIQKYFSMYDSFQLQDLFSQD